MGFWGPPPQKKRASSGIYGEKSLRLASASCCYLSNDSSSVDTVEVQPEMVELNKSGIFCWLSPTFISTINMLGLLRKRLSVDAE